MSAVPAHHDDFSQELYWRLEEVAQLQAAHDLRREAGVEPQKPKLKRKVTVQIPAGHGPSKEYPKSPRPELRHDDACSSSSSTSSDMLLLDREILDELAALDDEVARLQAAQDLAEAGGKAPKPTKRVFIQIPAGHGQSKTYPKSPFPRPQDTSTRIAIPDPELFLSPRRDDVCSMTQADDLRSPLLGREAMEELAGQDGDERQRQARRAFVHRLGATGALSFTIFGLACWPFGASKPNGL